LIADAALSQNGWTPLQWAASRGHVDSIRALIKAGADYLHGDNQGRTPMHHAGLQPCCRNQGTNQAGVNLSAQSLVGILHLRRILEMHHFTELQFTLTFVKH